MLVIDSKLRVPLAEFEFSFARSGGPGGQNVNKVNTKALLRWRPLTSPSLPEDLRNRFAVRYRNRLTADGELLITSQRYRDQQRNVADCLEKLRLLVLSVATPPRRRRPTRPTQASRERRLDEKRRDSRTKGSRQGRDWAS